ncbi:hypothetical protein Rahaq_4973 (plasmid) [Rahnella aceris]|uniref:Uncharacterized protein n=1 Tax=Rahnella sp. (strain Y9602) TaxID=2703885 RepID=A0A0H3FNS8_RAHSY|nr:flagellar FlbD family protein [Rahnella aceris]ADW76548.1 hypothetical protein Rahaq_4973 [Rahnella aceris]
MIIKLSQQVIYGWEDGAKYEPVWVNTNLIESMSWAGLTHIKMSSGDKIKVKEPIEEILQFLKEQPHD